MGNEELWKRWRLDVRVLSDNESDSNKDDKDGKDNKHSSDNKDTTFDKDDEPVRAIAEKSLPPADHRLLDAQCAELRKRSAAHMCASGAHECTPRCWSWRRRRR